MEYSHSTINSVCKPNSQEDNWLEPNMMQILQDGVILNHGMDMNEILDEFIDDHDKPPALLSKESMFEYSSANIGDIQKDLMLRKTESVRTGGTVNSKDNS